MKKWMVITALIAAAGVQQAAAYYWLDTAGDDWNVAANWSDLAGGGAVPGSSDSALLHSGIGATVWPTIRSAVPDAGLIGVGWDSNGAELYVVENGFVQAGIFRVGFNGTGTLSMSGGTVIVSGQLDVGYALETPGTGTINMSGSSTLHAANAVFNSGSVNLTGNALFLINEDHVSNGDVTNWLGNGSIAAPAGGEMLQVVYNSAANRTEFTVIPDPATVGIVYRDDFEGSAGDAINTVPEIYSLGFSPTSFEAILDGNGMLSSETNSSYFSDYRFKIASTPLTSDPSIATISWKANVRMPTDSWIAIGFHGNDLPNLIDGALNAGPYVRFDPAASFITGGTGLEDMQHFPGTHTPGAVVEVESVYHVWSSTMDLYVDGVNVATNVAVTHYSAPGVPADPVIAYAQLHFYLQEPAAAGGPYVDDFEISVEHVFLSTSNGTPHAWLDGYYTNLVDIADYEAADTGDSDADGYLGWQEYQTGTDPTDSVSLFRITSSEQVGTGFIITWTSSEFGTFALSTNVNLVSSSWGTTASNIVGQTPETSFTTTVSEASSFFKVELEQE